MSAQKYKENKYMNKNTNGNLAVHENEYCVFIYLQSYIMYRKLCCESTVFNYF
jgi:hypothetical protein